MLCPEVWDFKAPESSFSIQKRSLDESNHLNTINNFIYNHLVSVILPDTFKVPQSLSLNNDCDYYKLKQVKLSDFVSKDFINNFVNSGNLYVVSIDSRIDCDNCASITPTGNLILNLEKATYQSLGLEGAVSQFHAKTAARYIVSINLKQKHFKSGKRNYERTKTCLENLRLNFIATWEPPKQEICPSSIARYFHELGYETSLCEVTQKSHTLYTTRMPVESDNYYDIVEWLGMVAIEGDLSTHNPDNYLNTYDTPEPCREVGQVRFMQWRGLFTHNQILNLFQELRMLKESNNCEWLAMYVQGFSDSAIAWKGEEHHYYTNGDNSYTVILTKDEVITCQQKCSRKRYNNKRKGKPL